MSERNRRRDEEVVLDVDRVIIRADKVIIHSDNIIIRNDDDRRRDDDRRHDDIAGVEDLDDRRKSRPSRPFLNL